MHASQPLPVRPVGAHRLQANQLCRRLRRHQQNRHELLSWLHPSRFNLGVRALMATGSKMWPAHADLWLDSMGLPMPTVEAFTRGAPSLYGLSVPAVLRLMRLRALYAYGGELRHWVDARRRALLAGWLGPQAAIWMRALLGELSTDTDHRVDHSQAPLETCSADGLAWSGYCLMMRDGLLLDGGPCALVPLALDPAQATGVPAVFEYADAHGSAAVVRLSLRCEEVAT